MVSLFKIPQNLPYSYDRFMSYHHIRIRRSMS